MNKIVLTLFSLFMALLAVAQDTTGDAAASGPGLRANGKIYVVVAVVVTILIGLFIYVIRVDRKISRLEKKQH